MGGKNRFKGERQHAKTVSSKAKSSVKVANKQKNKQTKRSHSLQQREPAPDKKKPVDLQNVKHANKAKSRPKKKPKEVVGSGVENIFESTNAPELTQGAHFLARGNLAAAIPIPTKDSIKAENKSKKPEPTLDLSDEGEQEGDSESDDDSVDGAKDYERKPRVRQPPKQDLRLPVRSAEGSWEPNENLPEKHEPARQADSEKAPVNNKQVASADEGDDVDENEGDDERDFSEDDVDGEVGLSEEDNEAAPNQFEILQKRHQRVFRLKNEIAEMCSDMLQDPEKNLKKIDDLHALCTDNDQEISILATLSEAEVLGDLIPMYRIRLPTPAELTQVASKEVLATRTYESKLLSGYTRFLTFLLDEVKKGVGNKQRSQKNRVEKADGASPADLALCSSLCVLVQKAYHFNLRKELLACVTPLLNSRCEVVRQSVLKSIIFVFQNDSHGDCTLDIIKIIAKIIARIVTKMKKKGRAAKIKPELLKCLLELPLSHEVLESELPAKSKDKQSKKERKKLSKQGTQALEKDLKEAEGTVSLAHKKAVQTSILTELFTSYFRILKICPQSDVLPLVLQGVTKFALMINVELLFDLMELLKSLAANEPSLNVECRLRCVRTSLACLEGKAGSVDLKEFNLQLYALLVDLCVSQEHGQTSLLLNTLVIMLQKSTQLSLGRVAAFVKRMGALALCLPVGGQMAILHLIRFCFNRYPKLKQLLDVQCSTPGAHQPELPDPEHANAFASTAWELPLLASSHHPTVRTYATRLVLDEEMDVALAAKTVPQVFALYDLSQGAFNPPVPVPSSLTARSLNKGQRLKRKLCLATAGLESSESPFLKQLKQSRQQAL